MLCLVTILNMQLPGPELPHPLDSLPASKPEFFVLLTVYRLSVVQ